ncbi:MAG: glycerophosphodiester phosphodiesterase [Clostridiales bacterium]|nr:glycerophosphodiester phosphodiesterase [Clostridiales bacterium]
MVKAIAHRGFSSRYPENTLLAFERALDLGADGAEFDVQLSRDGVPVVIHDESLLRTAGDERLVKDLTLEELQRLDVSYRFAGSIPAQRIPTLEEYFTLVRERAFLSILEFKTAIFEYDGIEQTVIDMIRRFGLGDRIVLSSFNHYTLLRCKAIAPELPCGILYECRIAEPQDYCRRLNMQYLHPDYRFLSDAELAKYEQAGVKTSPWTVDQDADIRYLIKQPNIFAIMSNKPDRVLALRAEA